jgi:hypothetical protein
MLSIDGQKALRQPIASFVCLLYVVNFVLSLPHPSNLCQWLRVIFLDNARNQSLDCFSRLYEPSFLSWSATNPYDDSTYNNLEIPNLAICVALSCYIVSLRSLEDSLYMTMYIFG